MAQKRRTAAEYGNPPKRQRHAGSPGYASNDIGSFPLQTEFVDHDPPVDVKGSADAFAAAETMEEFLGTIPWAKNLPKHDKDMCNKLVVAIHVLDAHAKYARHHNPIDLIAYRTDVDRAVRVLQTQQMQRRSSGNPQRLLEPLVQLRACLGPLSNDSEDTSAAHVADIVEYVSKAMGDPNLSSSDAWWDVINEIIDIDVDAYDHSRAAHR